MVEPAAMPPIVLRARGLDGGVKRQRPKEENAFSDFIKSHLGRDLKERGVIVNREAEIRRSIGTSPGERTDIHVDAVLPGAGRGGAGTPRG